MQRNVTNRELVQQLEVTQEKQKDSEMVFQKLLSPSVFFDIKTMLKRLSQEEGLPTEVSREL